MNYVNEANFGTSEYVYTVLASDSKFPAFLAAIDSSPMRNAYALCLFAGLREGECLGLSWKQVDFQRGRITVSQQLQREKVKGGKYYIAPSTKSGKPRTIEPPSIAFGYLRAEKKRQAENRLKAGPLWNNLDDLVFTDAAGTHYAIVSFGRPDARPHDLRHTAATVAIASGADIKSVQPAKGLSSIKTQKALNISEDKKGVGNQAHHRWTECIK